MPCNYFKNIYIFVVVVYYLFISLTYRNSKKQIMKQSTQIKIGLIMIAYFPIRILIQLIFNI